MSGPLMEVRFAGAWRSARLDGESVIVTVPENGPVFIGIRIGLRAIERRLSEGTARMIPGPYKPPAIVCADPAVAGMLDGMGIPRAQSAA